MDPQQYVELGVQLAVITDARSCEYRNANGFPFGNEPYTQIKTIERANAGDLLIYKQKSNLFLTRTYEFDIMYKPILGIYKEHAQIDILETKALIDDGEKKHVPKKVDLRACFAVFGNQSQFSLLYKYLKVLTAILNKAESYQFPELEDPTDDTPAYHPMLRRLAYILSLKTSATEHEDGRLFLRSLIQDTIKEAGFRDALVKIGRISPIFSLLNALGDQNDFGELVASSSLVVTNELNNCFQETKSTRLITELDWPRDRAILTTRSNKATIKKEDLDELLADDEDKVTQTIKVKMINVDWLYRDKHNFVSFATLLEELPSTVYASEFIEVLLDQFWSEQQTRIKRWQFYPYLIYAFVAIWFMVLSLTEDVVTVKDEREELIFIILGSITLVLWANQVKNEIQQFCGSRSALTYFTSIWNLFDIFGLAAVAVIAVIQMSSQLSVQQTTYIPGEYLQYTADLIDIHTLRIIAAVASFCLIAKFFDWLRLFDTTAFYIDLLYETLSGIKAFLILIVTSLMLFGVPMVMLNLNRTDDVQVIDPTFGHWLPDMFLNQYFLSLGEFNFGNFQGNEQAIFCYVLFIGATFFTQITMLNMLIAIMGDSFERVIQNAAVNGTKIKLKFLKDMAGTVGQRSKYDDDKIFMFVVKPDDADNAVDDWEGSVKMITKLLSNGFDTLNKQIKVKNDKLQDTIEESMNKDQASDLVLRETITAAVANESKKIMKKMKKMTNVFKSTLEKVAPEALKDGQLGTIAEQNESSDSD